MENNTNAFSETTLNELLGRAFLNMDFSQPENQKIMEAVASYSLGVSGTATSFFGKSTITKLLGILAGIGIVSTATFFFQNNNYRPKKNSSLVIPIEQKKTDSVLAI